MQRVLDSILVLVVAFAHACGLYGWYHRQWRRWEARRLAAIPPVELRGFDLAPYLQQLAENARRLYRRDGWRRLWDSISLPKRYQAFLDGTLDVDEEGSNDCDDAAVWIAEVLRLLRSRGQAGVGEIRLLQVIWRSRKGELMAHHVCAYHIEGDGWYNVSNSARRGPFVASEPSLALFDMAQEMTGSGRLLCAYHAHPSTLRGWTRLAADDRS